MRARVNPLVDADFLATIPFIDVVPNPLLECLDVGSAFTMGLDPSEASSAA